MVVRPADGDQRARLRQVLGRPELPGANPEGREDFGALRPEQIAEGAPVRESCGIDAVIVNSELLSQGRQHRVEEFQISVALLACLALPAGARALRVNLSRRRQTLRI